MWYEWNTKEEFDIWHDGLCDALGYPLTPVNQATGLPDESAQKVVRYTNAIEVKDKWIAWVDDENSEGLIKTKLKRPVRVIE